MQPAQTNTARPSWMKWLPVAVIAVAVVVVGAVVLMSSGSDDGGAPELADTETTAAPDETAAPDTIDDGVLADFPLTFDEAAERGVEIDWGERCDTERGVLAVPDFFASVCYAPFGDNDNGGATATGVTADSVTVVYYLAAEGDPIINFITEAVRVDDTNAEEYETLLGLVEYFETFYETYGRKINLVLYEGSGVANDDVAARADAVRIAEEFQPFAVLGGPALSSAFADELAARQITCISCTPSQPNEFYQSRQPYVWAIDASQLQKNQHVAEFIGQQLASGTAAFAGDESLHDQPRRFGLLYLDTGGSTEAIDAFIDDLSALGVEFVERVPYALDPATLQQTAAQAISRLKAAGVTTVVFNGDPIAPREFTREATAQGFFPEWVIGAVTLVDTAAFSRTYDQSQWANAFGVTSGSARRTREENGYYRIYTWFTGEEPPGPGTIAVNAPALGLFFAALQAVGPDLTHENFGARLAAVSPTQRSVSQPSLSWGEQGIWPFFDFHGIDDATIFWWDPDAEGPDEIGRDGKGLWQYVDGGRRYLPGEWPSEVKLFDPNGAVTIYFTAPEGETPPDYPSPRR